MTFLAKALLYWRTARHLKPIQLYGRLWFRLYRPGIDRVEGSPRLRARHGRWQPPADRAPSMLGPWHFRFLNHEQMLPAQGGWNDATLEKLWLYNLHYFDDLNARDANVRTAWHLALLQRWMAENPPAFGNGWEPYPTSLRIVNWAKWLLAGHSPPSGFTQSLATQARWLARRLEWHLLGNHLFANAKALVFAGLLFEGDEADGWLAKGLKILAQEVPEQVLADGGHFERSTMYHALVLEDLLDLVNAVNLWPGKVDPDVLSNWHDASRRMLAWLQGMTHPDGQIALFNDASFGVALEPAALSAYAQRLGIVVPSPKPVKALALQHRSHSGYVRLSSGKAVAMLDVAPAGPEYLMAHAHADTLSFELSVWGQRVVVNGGTSDYGLGPERLRQRGTSAHSTVEVGGLSSSEVWGGFRVARRAYPFDLQVQEEPGRLTVACCHDGYTRLPGRPVHHREWAMDAGSLLVTDAVMGGAHSAVARYILHPAVQIAAVGDSAWRLALPSGQFLQVHVLAGRPAIEPARYAPEFGKVLQTQCLAVELIQGQAQTKWIWN